MPDVPIPVRELEFSLSFCECHAGDGWVLIPDAIDVEIAPRSGKWRESWSCTCLEHLFLLLDQLEREEDGWALFGTGAVPVEFDENAVRLRGSRELLGTRAEMKTVVRGLIATGFEKLDAIDPVGVHDELRS